MSNRILVVGLSTTLMVLGVGLGWFGSQMLTEPTVITKEVQIEEQETELTEEEQEALKPQDVKVENPWIYE